MAGNDHTLKKNIKLIGLDLDGTVLNNKKEMTPMVSYAIEKAISMGVTVVPVTGRPLSGIPDSIKRISGIKYAITSNGAIMADLENNTVCRSDFLPDYTIDYMLNLAEEYQCIYSVFINGTGYSEMKDHKRLVEMFHGTPLVSYVEKSRRGVLDIRKFFKDESLVRFDDSQKLKYGIHNEKRLKNSSCVENFWICSKSIEHCDHIENAIRERFPKLNIHRMMKTDIEMVAPTADKGQAFLELASMLGIDQCKTAAIGDSVNDCGFMKKAGMSIAMGNASESVKALADYITEDNEHDGAGMAIMRII